MKPVIDAVLGFISPKKAKLIDFVDRCCCRYTPLLLSVLMLITGSVDMYGKPINCWMPAEYTGSWTNFVQQYCYVTGTYVKRYTGGNEDNGRPIVERMYVDYYQWVPFLFILQAIIIYFPHFVWRYGQHKGDIDFAHVHTVCEKIRSDDAAKRAENVDAAANYIYQVAKLRGFRGIGNKTIYYYTAFKALNILAALALITCLTIFVGSHGFGWGFTLASQAWNPSRYDVGVVHNEHVMKFFPRVVFCEYYRDEQGHPEAGAPRHTRCSLGINMLNEKLFLMLYFWYHTLLAMTIVYGLHFMRLLIPYYRAHFVRNLLAMVNRKDVFEDVFHRVSTDAQSIEQFCDEVLGEDGLLLFRFLHQNLGRLVAVEVCSRLYHLHAADQRKVMSISSTTRSTNGGGHGHHHKEQQQQQLGRSFYANTTCSPTGTVLTPLKEEV